MLFSIKKEACFVTLFWQLCFILNAVFGHANGNNGSGSHGLTVVDIGFKSDSLSVSKLIQVQVCSGLFNRDASVAGNVYTLSRQTDLDWLEDTTAVLDAVPLEDGDPLMQNNVMVFDAVSKFSGWSALEVTSFMYDEYVNMTTSMSMTNPGLDPRHPFEPRVIEPMNTVFLDYVVKERLFNFYMMFACIPYTKEHQLMEKMVKTSPWPKPIAVYGYDDTFFLWDNYWFEAETTCVKEHNLGQVATNNASNLAFFSSKERITKPLRQNPDPDYSEETFSPSQTYLSVIIGDGDNIAYLQGARREWMKQRISRCDKGKTTRECFPLLWTVSPHTLYIAPEWARWYYNKSYTTKMDYFVLPPCGDLYAYPSLLSDKDQSTFVSNTERDCNLLSTNGVVAWEWFGTWKNAAEHYFPRYAENGIVRALFAVDDPFDLPVFIFDEDEQYKIFGQGNKSTILFRPNEWRGTVKEPIPFSHKNTLSAKDMAAKINGYPRGTVSHIYVTSDGGADLNLVYSMVEQLDPHVNIVNQNTLVNMAIQRDLYLQKNNFKILNDL